MSGEREVPGPVPGKMDPDRKARWVAALRSGKFHQGTGRLKQADRYCCLGVLCAVENVPEVLSALHRSGFGATAAELVLPKEILDVEPELSDRPTVPRALLTSDESQKLRETWPAITYEWDVVVPLHALNDMGLNFSRIADLIEEAL